MGNSSSIVENSALENKIRKEVKKLIYNYNFWTKQQICNNLEVLYYNKLIQFEKSDLIDVSMSIGVKNPKGEEIDKDILCQQIIDHYKRRIRVLDNILKAVERNQFKILRAKSGNVCRRVDEYIEDFYTCEKYNGLWLNEEQYEKLLNRMKENGTYTKWKHNFNKLKEQYFDYLKKLLDIIEKIKLDIDNTVNEDTITQIESFVTETIVKMNKICNALHLMVINSS